MSKTVLITGARGNLGAKLRSHFTDLGWTVRLLDRTAGGDPAIIEADLATYDEGDTFDQSASKGFVHVHGLSSKIAARRDLRAGRPQQ